MIIFNIHIVKNNMSICNVYNIYIQVAKQARTVPVRGFGAEERFDAEECDLENCAPPLPTPILRKKSHAWERIQNTSKKFARIGPEAPKMTSNGFSENDSWNQDAPKATLWVKVRNFDGPGHHWELDWVIFGSFLKILEAILASKIVKMACPKMTGWGQEGRRRPGTHWGRFRVHFWPILDIVLGPKNN